MARDALDREIEDRFTNRYASFAATRANNFAAEDAAIAKVNAAGRLATGRDDSLYNPSVSNANDDVARAMDRADALSAGRATVAPSIADTHFDDINARRSQIDSQRRQIQARLGLISPREAGVAAVVLAPREKRKELFAHLNYLEDADRGLAAESHTVALERAAKAHETFAREKHIDAAQGFTNLANRLLEVRRATKRGTPERAQAIHQAVIDFPNGFTTQAGQALVRQMSQEHDEAARLATDLTPPEGMALKSINRSGGKETAVFAPKQPTLTFGSREDAEKAAGGGKVRQNDRGQWYVEEIGGKGGDAATPKAFQEKVAGLGLTPYDFENRDQWQRQGNKVFRKAEPTGKAGGKTITLDSEHYDVLQKEYDALHRGQFDDEAAARGAGHKTGDIVMLRNPKTGKYQRARLD